MNLYISTEIINFSQEGGWQALSEEEKKKKIWDHSERTKHLEKPHKPH